MLFRLLYASQPMPELACGRFDDEIARIRETALTRNPKRHLTGALAYSPRFFLQAIEGAREEVQRLYAEIARDARHDNLRIVLEREIETRAFPDWSMAFAPVGEDSTAWDTGRPNDAMRFLIEAAEQCMGARALPGYGPAPEAHAMGALRR